MVDTKEALESQYLNAELVMESPTKTIVVVDPGNYEDTNYGSRLTVKVNIDGKVKEWRPNKDSIEKLNELFDTTDTMKWLGIPVVVETKIMQNQKLGVIVTGLAKVSVAKEKTIVDKKAKEAVA